MYRFILSFTILVYSVSSSEIRNKTQKDEIGNSLANNCIDASSKCHLASTNFDKALNIGRLTSKIKNAFCQQPTSLENSNNREHPDEKEQYDTLTQSDIVRSQYSKLPYPAVKSHILAQEKAYYDYYGKRVMAFGENRTIPFSISFGITLEAINHFLYEGKNNFR